MTDSLEEGTLPTLISRQEFHGKIVTLYCRQRFFFFSPRILYNTRQIYFLLKNFFRRSFSFAASRPAFSDFSFFFFYSTNATFFSDFFEHRKQILYGQQT
jgi:hypothetical protein